MNTPDLDTWVDRAQRMAAYAEEARDFIRRASSELPVTTADIGSVCCLWALADEQDVTVCAALERFDRALFDSTGEIDITRGAEAGDSGVSYLCTWAMRWPDERFVGVTLSADQGDARAQVEVRHSGGGRWQAAFGDEIPSGLYEALGRAFFAVAVNR